MRRSLSVLILVAGVGCRPAAPPPPPLTAAAPAATAPSPTAASTPMPPAPAEASAGQPAAHAEEAGALRLDAGKRWKATPETTEGIGRMKALANAVDPETVTDAAVLHDLGTKLQAELDGIIARCTMTGEAHEQLHVYLIPLYTQVARLKQGSLPEAREAATSLRATLAEYDTYFE